MADHPLRPAIDRSLGGPLPHQLANRTRAAPMAINLSPKRAYPVLAQVSLSYPRPKGTFPRVTHPSAADPEGPARLACVKPAASVRSEPGSNSHVGERSHPSHSFDGVTSQTSVSTSLYESLYQSASGNIPHSANPKPALKASPKSAAQKHRRPRFSSRFTCQRAIGRNPRETSPHKPSNRQSREAYRSRPHKAQSLEEEMHAARRSRRQRP